MGPPAPASGARPAVRTLLVDLDGTLYDISNGYEEHVRQNVFRFMVERLGVPDAATARALWKRHFSAYNQTLLALRAGASFRFDAGDYWDYIRAGASDFLRPDPALRALLLSLPQHKWVFTNCNEKHCRIALNLLGLQGVFEGIVGADAMGDCAKPSADAFRVALAAAGEAPGPHIAMLEDSLKNLRTAKALGLTTLLVGSATAAEEAGGAAALGHKPYQGTGGASSSAGCPGGAAAGPGNAAADGACRPCDGAHGAARGDACLDAAVSALIEPELRRALPHLWDGGARAGAQAAAALPAPAG